ncbi:MAG: hypothetical protein WD009_12965 [Phycisphaeraceae bacterium]
MLADLTLHIHVMLIVIGLQAVIIALAGIYFMFVRPHRAPRAVCPACQYAIHPPVPPTCPECGHDLVRHPPDRAADLPGRVAVVTLLLLIAAIPIAYVAAMLLTG